MVITMRADLRELKRNDTRRALYTFYSAKKIYLARMSSKIVLLEKKETDDFSKTLSLKERNTVVISKENGMLLFPRSR